MRAVGSNQLTLSFRSMPQYLSSSLFLCARMQLRAGAASITQRKTSSSAEDRKAAVFGVLSCEAGLKAGVRTASITLPKAIPQKIIVIGDTGCRLKKGDNYFQGCDNTDE